MWKWSLLILLLAACSPQMPSVNLHPDRAMPGEEVRAILTNLDSRTAQLYVEGEEVEITAREPGLLRFKAPSLPGGPKRVRVVEGGKEAYTTLGLLGRVEPGRALVYFPPGTGLEKLKAAGFGILERYDLGSSCNLELVKVGFEKPLGEALAELEALDPAYKADPESLWSFDAVDGPREVGAPLAHQRGHRGQGVKVAVLDTGVEPSLPQQLPGYDFVENDPTPQDAFPGGHGTGVASLVLGVAPEAQIIPLRVCDQTGTCRASRVVRGVCWVLDQTPSPTVLNLSLGGDTPVELLRSVLELALQKGYPVAAAAGNQGQYGSPTHFPAAFPLVGLVAVGALELDQGAWKPAPYSTRGGYVDLAAPGTDLSCLLPGGGTGSCTGTSFATPLVAGAMAVWLSADPSLNPVQLEAKLKYAARPLPYPPNAVGKGILDLSMSP